MELHLDSLPFDEWVRHVFDHEVREPQWYFDLDAPFWAAPAALTLAHVTRLLPGERASWAGALAFLLPRSCRRDHRSRHEPLERLAFRADFLCTKRTDGLCPIVAP
jgi:hypothetical protein